MAKQKFSFYYKYKSNMPSSGDKIDMGNGLRHALVQHTILLT